jgi:hypothetical protein
MQDQPVVSVAAEGLRNDLLELRLDLVDRLAWSQAGAVADPEDVRVDRERLLAERGIEDHVRGLSSDPRQRLQFLAGTRHFTAVAIDQRLAEGDDVPGFGVEQADRLDRLAKIILAEIDHLPRRPDAGEQRPGRNVDACIGRLGRKHDGNQQLVGIAGFEFGRWRRIRLGQPAEEFENLVARHDFPITSRIE